MRSVFHLLVAAACLGFVAIALPACETTDETTSQPTTQTSMVSPGALALCTGCGQVKGSAMCCQPGQPTCSGCSLDKGSPGCCRIEPGSTEPVAVCTTCGHINGSEMCCKPYQTRCSSCGLVKGSAGCCKIDTN